MVKKNITQSSQYVTTQSNVPNAFTPVATLTIPAGTYYSIQDGTPLALKLYDASGNEMTATTDVYFAWQDPISETIYQGGRTMNYGIFAAISAANQQDVNTQANRTIDFDSAELDRAARGEASLLTGLGPDYKIVIMVKSPSTISMSYASTSFLFNAIVATEAEHAAQMKGKGGQTTG